MVVPLTGAYASVKIFDYLAEVTVKERYVNEENTPIEATYEFPLHVGAAVNSFVAEIDGEKLVGECKEKEKAKNKYDDAIGNFK